MVLLPFQSHVSSVSLRLALLLLAVAPLLFFTGKAASAASTESVEEEEDVELLSNHILFLIMLIFFGGTVFLTFEEQIPVPHTVVLFVYGLAAGGLTQWVAPEVGETLANIPPDLLFFIFLPVLIFEGSFSMNIHAFRRVIWQTVLLATVGVLLNVAIMSVPTKFLFSEWPWKTAMLLGSLLSATDPVAVVSLFKTLKVNKYLASMVNGEAVMNDGTAIALFTILTSSTSSSSSSEHTVLSVLLTAAQMIFIPLALGPLFGFIQLFWIRHTNSAMVKACVTVSVSYVSYYIALEWCKTSAVLTICWEAIFLSNYYPSLFPGTELNFISATWEFLVHLSNTVLFSLVGVILVADVLPTARIVDVFHVIVLYLLMTLARVAMLEAMLPLLNLFRYQLEQKEVMMLTHAGLRGGVAVTLALAVKHKESEYGIEVMKLTSGVVLLTLIVNATTSSIVTKALGFTVLPEYRHIEMEYAMQFVRDTERRALETVKRDTKYRNANWHLIEQHLHRHLRNPYRHMGSTEDGEVTSLNRLTMAAFKASLWRQRDEGVISETVIQQLTHLVNNLIEKGELLSVRSLSLYHGEEAEEGRAHQRDAIDNRSGRQQQQPQRPGEAAAAASRPHPGTTTSTANTATEPGGIGSSRQHLTAPAHGNASQRSVSSAATHRSGRTGSVLTPTAMSSLSLHPHGTGEQQPGSLGMMPSLYSLAEEDEDATQVLLQQEEEEARAEGLEIAVELNPEGLTAEEEEREEENADATATTLMRRLLPLWVRLAERFVGETLLESAHQRVQENAFMTILAVVKGLTSVTTIKYQYVSSPEQARRINTWLQQQLKDATACMKFFYRHFSEVTRYVSSTRAVLSVTHHLHEAVETLHRKHGLGHKMTEQLKRVVEEMRDTMPERWEQVNSQEFDLTMRAVASTTLGKGLRKAEIHTISSMGLVRKLKAGDVLTLPASAFLVVVFGSLRTMRHRWNTAHAEHNMIESFGDTVGLDSFLLPDAMRRATPRRWEVLTEEATVLLISFQSIQPFLTERSLRAVKALWRAAAVEVILPILQEMVTVPQRQEKNQREHLMGLVMAGTPLIGPEDCNQFQWGSPLHLCFYLRGGDRDGLFCADCPPCHVSTLYVNQVVWTSSDVVLYVVPVNFSDGGYVPWGGVDEDEAATAPAGVEQGGPPEAVLMNPALLATTPSVVVASGVRGVFITSAQLGIRDKQRRQELQQRRNRRRPPSTASSSRNAVAVPHQTGSGSAEQQQPLPGQGSRSNQTSQDPATGSLASGSTFSSGSSHHRPGGAAAEDTDIDVSTTSTGGTASTAPGGHSGGPLPYYSPASPLAPSGGDRSSQFPRGGRRGRGAAQGSGQDGTDPTFATAMDVLNKVLRGEMPHHTTTSSAEQLDDDDDNVGDLSIIDSGLGTSFLLRSPLFHSPGRRRSFEDDGCVVLQHLPQSVSPIPLVNHLFIRYASMLELLCVAAIRYVLLPSDVLNIRHAQRVGDRTVEFLLRFGIEIQLLQAVVQRQRMTQEEARRDKQEKLRSTMASVGEGDVEVVVQDETPEATHDSMKRAPASLTTPPHHRASDEATVDAAFQVKVCCWARQAERCARYPLRSIIMTMRAYANYRFEAIVAASTQAAEQQPDLRRVSCVEELRHFLQAPTPQPSMTLNPL